MKVLVVGSGGREHAFVWKIMQSGLVEELYAAPGNAGTGMLGTNIPLKVDDIRGLRDFAEDRKIDLTVVGPENPLADGIVDEFKRRGLRIFGPNSQAARIESSKSYAKDMMRYNGIPTGEYNVFHDYGEALSFLRGNWRDDCRWVPKGNGLAGGKAVFVCNILEEAEHALRRLMIDREFGPAGDLVVVERRLYGKEVSHIGFASGTTFFPFPPTQDYKPVGDGNIGPNTGGMGSFSPRHVNSSLLKEFDERIMIPMLNGIQSEGIHYSGVLYGGLMVTDNGPDVLEFNCRAGDPETQPTLARMKSDIIPYLEACIDGTLDRMSPIEWDPRYSVCLVLASGGYPIEYERGKLITGLRDVERMNDVIVFHAGTSLEEGKVYTNGGRVLGVTALGDTLDQARERAYEAAERIRFENKYNRSDIAIV